MILALFLSACTTPPPAKTNILLPCDKGATQVITNLIYSLGELGLVGYGLGAFDGITTLFITEGSPLVLEAAAKAGFINPQSTEEIVKALEYAGFKNNGVDTQGFTQYTRPSNWTPDNGCGPTPPPPSLPTSMIPPLSGAAAAMIMGGLLLGGGLIWWNSRRRPGRSGGILRQPDGVFT